MDELTEKLAFMPQTLRGEILRVVFVTPEDDYAVIKISGEDGREYSVVGAMASPCEGQTIEVTGIWEKHAEYGQQLRASSYRYSLPSTKKGLTRYLSSGAVKGIGKTLAAKIVNYFGDNTINILDNYPGELMNVPKIGPVKAASIAKAWKESSVQREIFIFLQGLGISTAYCRRLYKRYGEAAADAVKQNPYRLAEEVDGIGFKKADEIALNMGIPRDAVERMTAAAVFSINQCISAGHVGYPEDLLLDAMAVIVEINNSELLHNGIENALQRKLLVRRDGLIYSPQLAFAELELPKQVRRLAEASKFAGAKLKYVAADPNMKFCDEQMAAVEKVRQYPLTIITGGPGVGKTTVLSEIVRRANQAHLKIALAAPTGRAAKRLAEATGHPAKTIHRLLQYDGASGRFVHNETLPLAYDLIIADEVSMLDILLALSLFRAIKSGTSVILVGDADQLPSVGPGSVLLDFITCRYFKTTHLSKIFRQGKGSEIIVNAHLVNRGRLPERRTDRPDLSDFYWIEQDEPEKVLNVIGKLIKERIPLRFKFDPYQDVQVLTPMNRGSCGALALNEFLQNLLNGGEKPSFRSGERIFKLNDKVMQTSNNYDKNVFNGDLGRIIQISSSQKNFIVEFEDGRQIEYSFEEALELTMAYAITIHKSQGSEFKVVILTLLNQHYVMLQRNLLYTGMTRARNLLILIGGEKSVSLAVGNQKLEKRYSMLAKYLSQ